MSFITFTAVIVFFVSPFAFLLLSINLKVISYKLVISAFTTFVKNFYGRGFGSLYHQYIQDQYAAGYINDAAAMTSIRFQMAAGNINAGKIKMYGIK